MVLDKVSKVKEEAKGTEVGWWGVGLEGRETEKKEKLCVLTKVGVGDIERGKNGSVGGGTGKPQT